MFRGKQRTYKYEDMRPQEILDAMQEKSICYLPVGPLEWHGPAMPYGTDPVTAYETAVEVQKRVGGVVLPTLYAGTERERDEETLKSMGFNGDEYVVGQDFPKNSLCSFYMREEVFSLVIREYLRHLSMQGFKLIVIMNGHGATNQVTALKRLAAEFSAETQSKVIVVIGVGSIGPEDAYEGHATKSETSVQMYLRPDDVDLSMLPPKEVKLKNCDWGITGATAYAHTPNADHTIEEQCDPRNATAELGARYMASAVELMVEEVSKAWNALEK